MKSNIPRNTVTSSPCRARLLVTFYLGDGRKKKKQDPPRAEPPHVSDSGWYHRLGADCRGLSLPVDCDTGPASSKSASNRRCRQRLYRSIAEPVSRCYSDSRSDDVLSVDCRSSTLIRFSGQDILIYSFQTRINQVLISSD